MSMAMTMPVTMFMLGLVGCILVVDLQGHKEARWIKVWIIAAYT